MSDTKMTLAEALDKLRELTKGDAQLHYFRIEFEVTEFSWNETNFVWKIDAGGHRPIVQGFTLAEAVAAAEKLFHAPTTETLIAIADESLA